MKTIEKIKKLGFNVNVNSGWEETYNKFKGIVENKRVVDYDVFYNDDCIIASEKSITKAYSEAKSYFNR